MIELKLLLFYYLSSVPAFATLGALWATALKARGENIEIKHGIVSLLALQLACFVSFGLGTQVVAFAFKMLGIF